MGQMFPGGAYERAGTLVNSEGEPLTPEQQKDFKAWQKRHEAEMQERTRADEELRAQQFRNANPLIAAAVEATAATAQPARSSRKAASKE